MKQTDKQDKIQKENRNKLPGFLFLVALGGVIGACTGIFSNWLAVIVSPAELSHATTQALGTATPFLALCCFPFLAATLLCLHKAQMLFDRWDGDDEQLPEQIEQRLNWAMLWISITQFLVFLSMGFCFSLLPLDAIQSSVALIVLFFVIVVLFFCIGLQRRVVDLTRRMNPEKQGSVYDIKFRKKWYGSCDEAERRRIGEASYTAYITISYTSLFLWVTMAVLNVFIPVGPLPVLTALVPWGIGQVTYLLHCIRAQAKS